jgi:hypothetical protein
VGGFAPLLDPPGPASVDPPEDIPPDEDPPDDDPLDDDPPDDDPPGDPPPDDDPPDPEAPDEDPMDARLSTAASWLRTAASFALLGPTDAAAGPASPEPPQSAPPFGAGPEHAETNHPPHTIAAREERLRSRTAAADLCDFERMRICERDIGVTGRCGGGSKKSGNPPCWPELRIGWPEIRNDYRAQRPGTNICAKRSGRATPRAVMISRALLTRSRPSPPLSRDPS